MEATLSKDAVKTYYGQTLTSNKDLKTSACACTNEGLTPSVKTALADIHDEIMTRFYGCGSPIPPLLDGCTILDLGCGTGRDVYVAAKLAGPAGRVIGVDMTEAQLEVAMRLKHEQMATLALAPDQVEFHLGHMEDLKSIGIEDNSVDVVMSNCVINLSPDKGKVFEEIFRVLKPGGELIFSDVFSGRRVPPHLFADPVLHGECLAGALYREDFRRMLTALGCPDYRVVNTRPLAVDDPEVAALIGMVDFYSDTVRAFKIASLEDRCEDYGQIATYRGSIADHPHTFALDMQHRFITGKPQLVCGNTAAMLQETRYRAHFEVTGDRSQHFGLFGSEPGQTPPEGF